MSAATSMSPERRVSWPTRTRPPGPARRDGDGATERVREAGLQVDVGDAADAVGAEERLMPLTRRAVDRADRDADASRA